MQEAKQMADRIGDPAELWKLERYLTRRRKDIDRKYDFRGSQLTSILGILLGEHRITEEELRGLPEDKLKPIRACAEVFSDNAA
jgi:hypothetical protein